MLFSLLSLLLSVKSSLFLQLYYLFPKQGNAITCEVVIDEDVLALSIR